MSNHTILILGKEQEVEKSEEFKLSQKELNQ